MLSYFRYISVISFLLVLAAAFFAGTYFRGFAVEKLIRESLIEDSQLIANYYSERIWCRYAPSLGKLNQKNLKSTPAFKRINNANNLILKAAPADKIVIHSSADSILYSTHNRDVVFFEDALAKGEMFNQAIQQNITSQIIYSAGYYDEANILQKGTIVEVDIKLAGHNCATDPKPSDAVMKFFYSREKEIESLKLFQFVVTGGIIATFLLLYFALFMSSRRAEKIINKQHDENVSLAEAKMRAEMQNKEKSMFLANVSHELRTPLNAIIGFSEIIRDEVMGPLNNNQYKEYISDINTSGVHLLSLINDILDYSKAEAQKLEVDFTDVDLSKTAHSCMRLVEPRANEAKVKLVEQVPPKSIVLQADPKRMKQVILNLLSNAVKFTPEGGQVTLEIREDVLAEKIHIIVRDTGIGIAPKDISKALAPFGQVDSALSRRYEGTGLGLPLTKKLTEIMHGTFDIQSEEGLGTTISLAFPVAALNAIKENPEEDKQF